MRSPVLIVSICMGKSIKILRVNKELPQFLDFNPFDTNAIFHEV